LPSYAPIAENERPSPVRETLGDEPRVIRFLPVVPGIFEFYCSKRLLFFERHKDKGMRGVIEVMP
jgi:hypothetical protein